MNLLKSDYYFLFCTLKIARHKNRGIYSYLNYLDPYPITLNERIRMREREIEREGDKGLRERRRERGRETKGE